MLSQLLESAPPRRRRSPGWTLASACAHVAIIGSAIVVTTRPETVDARPTVIKDTTITWVRVPDVPKQPDVGAMRRTTSLQPKMPAPIDFTVPHINATFDASKPFAVSDSAAADPFGPGLSVEASPYGSPLPSPGGVYEARAVDRLASALKNNPRPEYPDALRNVALQGDVLVTFVVDTTGRVMSGSITIVESTHDLFADAVRRWLPRTRYVPAEVQGGKVRQFVQQRIEFSIQR